MQFTYLGVRTLHDRYLLKSSDGSPIELPQHMFMAIAMFLAQNEDEPNEWAKRFYDMMSTFEVMMATPTLSNARTPHHQLCSCFVGSSPDDLGGIFGAYGEQAQLSKYGGGIGWDWNRIRALGSTIAGHKDAAAGVIPAMKIENDIAVYVDQLGTRKGAINVYLEPWHLDIYDFIDLKKNSGEERRRAHDLFTSIWISDLFMNRVAADEDWTLFDPYDVQDLSEIHGTEFEEVYTAYENRDDIKKRVVKAKDLWRKIIVSYFETGSPFIGYKDTVNRTHMNPHKGIIRSSNLCVTGDTKVLTKAYGYVPIGAVAGKTLECWNGEEWSMTELFQTSEGQEVLKVSLSNGQTIEATPYHKWYIVQEDTDEYTKESMKRTWELVEGDEIIDFDPNYYDRCNPIFIKILSVTNEGKVAPTYCGTEPKRNRLMFNGVLTGNCMEYLHYTDEDNIAVCNLASVNLSKINSKEDIDRIVPVAMRALDNVIDINFYPVEKAKNTHRTTRSVGLGVMGEAQMVAEKQIHFGSDKHMKLIDEVMGNIRAAAEGASMQLAEERGVYPAWRGSQWEAEGKMMRNGYIMAIAPTSSISILVGTTQSVEPIYKRKWYEENLSGLIPVCAPNLSPETWEYYTTAYDVDQVSLIKLAAIRQKHVDQGQSLNVFIKRENASGKYLSALYFLAWAEGVKTTYYLRSESPEEAKDDTVDRSMECTGCQ